MQLFEMQGLLAGKCLPGDMKVNEPLAEYLLRKLEDRNELERQLSAKTISEQSIINAFGIKGEGAYSKLVIEYVHGLVAESEALKQAIPKPNEIDFHDDRLDDVSVAEQVGFNHAISKITKSMQETPNTEAFTAELRAQGVDEYAQAFSENTDMDFACNKGFYHGALDFAANLRAGRKG